MKYNLHFKVEGAVLVTDKSTGNATNHRLHWEPDNGNEFINFLNFRQFINQNAVFFHKISKTFDRKTNILV